jgi:biotin operon repressor
MTPNTRHVWRAISCAERPLTLRAIGVRCHLSVTAVWHHMRKLRDAGVIDRTWKEHGYTVREPFCWVEV